MTSTSRYIACSSLPKLSFASEAMRHFAIFVLVIFALTTAENINVKQCEPERMIVEKEVIRACVYFDKRNIKRVAVGYNLQSPAAKTDFQAIGADFEKFYNGPVTPVSEKCNCSDVPCLDERQIDELLEKSLKVSNVRRLSCQACLTKHCF